MRRLTKWLSRFRNTPAAIWWAIMHQHEPLDTIPHSRYWKEPT